MIILWCLGGAVTHAQSINYNPKSLAKDIQKIWEKDNIGLEEIDVPDSMINIDLLNQGKIFGIHADDKCLGFAYVSRVYSCRSGGCGDHGEPAEALSVDEDLEYFDAFILFEEDLTIKKIRVYNYQATHGHEVGSTGWLKQFVGYKGDEKLNYGKNVDAISGATISGNAITHKVQEAFIYMKLLKPVLDHHKPSSLVNGRWVK